MLSDIIPRATQARERNISYKSLMAVSVAQKKLWFTCLTSCWNLKKPAQKMLKQEHTIVYSISNLNTQSTSYFAKVLGYIWGSAL